jgi:hypothetical protein
VSEPPSDGLRRLKDHMPLSVRKVLREQVDRLTSNSRSHGPGGSNGSR